MAIEMFLSSQINTIDNSILWTCLDDDMDDAILLEHYGGETTCSSVSRAFRILRLRRNILLYLQHNIIQLNNDNTGSLVPHPERKLQHSDVRSLCGISRVFRMAISLTPCLNNIGKVRRDGRIRHYCFERLRASHVAYFLSHCSGWDSAEKAMPCRSLALTQTWAVQSSELFYRPITNFY